MSNRYARAAVLGVDGQDGHYLAQTLSEKGLSVIGIGRRPTAAAQPPARVERRVLDLRDHEALRVALKDAQPDLIFHVAAVHGATGFDYENAWPAVNAVNTVSVQICLEYIRIRQKGLFFYASSIKAIAPNADGVLSADSPNCASCLYSITKTAARQLIEYYRKQYGTACSIAILANHDSPRRSMEFFIPKLAAARRTARLNGRSSQFNTLDFMADFGHASEFMEIVAERAIHGPADDFVLATGRQVHGARLAEAFFAEAGLDYRDFLTVTQTGTPSPTPSVDLSRLDAAPVRRPRLTAIDVLRELDPL